MTLLLKVFLLNCVMNTQSLLDIVRYELAKELVSKVPGSIGDNYSVSSKIEGLAPSPPKTVNGIGFKV
jgi:hypothetical protein